MAFVLDINLSLVTQTLFDLRPNLSNIRLLIVALFSHNITSEHDAVDGSVTFTPRPRAFFPPSLPPSHFSGPRDTMKNYPRQEFTNLIYKYIKSGWTQRLDHNA